MPDKKKKIRLSPVVRPKMTVDEQSIRDLMNTPFASPNTVINTEFGPMAAPMPAYGGGPNIVGTELARLYQRFRNLAPNLDTHVSNIQFGPGAVATPLLQGGNSFESGRYYDPDRFGMSNLLGVTNPTTGDININPSLGNPEWLRHISMTGEYGMYSPEEVLGHELTHSAGYMGEEKPEEVEKLVRKIRMRK